MAPAGALIPTNGPAVGSEAPRLELETLDGRRLVIGGSRARASLQLVLFVSPSCSICKQVVPAARSFAHKENLELVFVGDDDTANKRTANTLYQIFAANPRNEERVEFLTPPVKSQGIDLMRTDVSHAYGRIVDFLTKELLG